jgi:hypothetical protein
MRSFAAWINPFMDLKVATHIRGRATPFPFNPAPTIENLDWK